ISGAGAGALAGRVTGAEGGSGSGLETVGIFIGVNPAFWTVCMVCGGVGAADALEISDSEPEFGLAGWKPFASISATATRMQNPRKAPVGLLMKLTASREFMACPLLAAAKVWPPKSRRNHF